MARVQITPQSVTRVGLKLSETAADDTNHHSFVNTGRNNIIVINNGGAGTRTITIDNPQTQDGNDVPDITMTISAGEIDAIGPFGKNYEQDDTTQTTTVEDTILFSLDSDTSVTVSVLSVGVAA